MRRCRRPKTCRRSDSRQANYCSVGMMCACCRSMAIMRPGNQDQCRGRSANRKLGAVPGKTGCKGRPVSSEPGAPTIEHDTGTLSQRDGCIGPTLQCGFIGRTRDRLILDAGNMLDDVVAISIPDVDPMGEVGPCRHRIRSRSSLASVNRASLSGVRSPRRWRSCRASVPQLAASVARRCMAATSEYSCVHR